jgi:DNA repair protein RadA
MPEETQKQITDIIGDLADQKEKKIVQFYKDHKSKKIKPVDPFEAYEKEQSQVKVKTGTLIDNMVGGGFEAGASMLLFGEYGSGKTETCFTIAVLCPDTVIFIDCEGSFRWSRIKEMCDERNIDYKIVFNKIKLFQPANWVELMMTLAQLPSPADEGIGKIGVIIIDSLTKLFRGIEFAGRQELQVKQPPIRELMITGTEIAKAFECALIFTTQIYESPNASAFMPKWASFKAVGGASIEHQASYVMFLRRAQGNVRIARLTDSDWKPLSERPYLITVKGIEDLPDTEKAAEVIEKAEKYETDQREALKDKEKKRKKAEEHSEEDGNPKNTDIETKGLTV